MTKRVFIGLTGASGVIYGLSIIKTLNTLGYETHITATYEALLNAEAESKIKFENINDMFEKNSISNSIIYDNNDLAASPSSGSFQIDTYIIAPASMGFIGRASSGISLNLIERCADVALKERKKLIILFREMPLSTIHLENMLKLSQAGAVIIPAAPGFYHKPETIDDLINFTAGKVLDAAGIENNCFKRWEK